MSFAVAASINPPNHRPRTKCAGELDVVTREREPPARDLTNAVPRVQLERKRRPDRSLLNRHHPQFACAAGGVSRGSRRTDRVAERRVRRTSEVVSCCIFEMLCFHCANSAEHLSKCLGILRACVRGDGGVANSVVSLRQRTPQEDASAIRARRDVLRHVREEPLLGQRLHLCRVLEHVLRVLLHHALVALRDSRAHGLGRDVIERLGLVQVLRVRHRVDDTRLLCHAPAISPPDASQPPLSSLMVSSRPPSTPPTPEQRQGEGRGGEGRGAPTVSTFPR